jgi:DNA replication protein DnaC
MDNAQQAQNAIRSVAERLADTERGAARRRQANKQEESLKYARANAAFQHQFKRNPTGVIQAHTWTCPFCSETMTPTIYDSPLVQGDVFVIRRDHCGCQKERDAILYQEEQAAQSKRDFNSTEWVLSLSRAGLTNWLTKATFDSFTAIIGTKQYERKQIIKQYCDQLLSGELGRRSWLVMFGDYGLGKTHLAAAVLHECIAAGKSCRLRVWPEWLESLRASFNGGDSGAIVRELKSGQIVALDDIDKQHPTEFSKEKLYTALNHRLNTGKPTILTFNRSVEEMEPWIGGAVVDRILGSVYACVQFTGTSYRRR